MISELHLIYSSIGILKPVDLNCPTITQEAIDKWFLEIRLTDQQHALEKIDNFLKLTNSYQIALADRHYLIEKLHAPVISLVGNLKPEFLNTLLPLNKKNNTQVALCLSVYHKLIIAYSIILHEQLANKNKSWSFLKALDTKIALSIQRIIRYLSQIVLTEFEVYRSSNELVWKKLYALFSFSEKKNFSTISILDPLINEKTSVKLTFLQVLLLALSDPYHYNQSQIYYIYKHLASWAKLVDLVAHKSIKQELFTAINLTDNYMPTFYPRGHQPNHQQALFLDAHLLSLDVLSQDSDFNNGFLSPKIKSGLLKQLKRAWSVYIDRSHDRNDYYTELKVVIGLNNVHFVLNNYQYPDWYNKASYSSKTATMSEVDYEKMMDKMPFQNNSLDQANMDVETILLTPRVETNAHLEKNNNSSDELDNKEIIHSFLTENESLNGLSLLWVNDIAINLKIGEVIALSHDKKKQPDNWFIGVIRRIQHFKNEPLKIGIQLLCPSGAIPVEVKETNQYNYHRGIYLPEFNLTKEKNSLLVSALTFSPKANIEINSCQGYPSKISQTQLHLVEEIETTPFYMRFGS